MLNEVLLASMGPAGGVSLVDVGSWRVLDRVDLPDAMFVIPAAVGGTYYALHGDEQAGWLTRVVLEGGRLHKRETVSTVGTLPCHADFLPDGALLIACYGDSRLSVVEFDADGAVRDDVQVIELQGQGPDAQRQERAHPHFVRAHTGGHDALAVDLGSDMVWAVDRSGTEWSVAPFAAVHAGAGPRHAVVAADTLIVTGELSGKISAVSLSGSADERAVDATHLEGDGPAYLGDVCLTASGHAAVAVRGRQSVSLFDLSVPMEPRLIAETAIPGSWPQQLYPVADRVVVVDRDGGRLVDLDPVTGDWQTLMDGLGAPMWITPTVASASVTA